MNTEVFALLDDASPEAAQTGGRSRLYTGHTGTLRCDDIAQWPQCWNRCRRRSRAASTQ
jgi:para-aminobenzoate synthetase/4-amino-4-deoxychorismate lyase